jgi:hypothetical protein
MISLVVVINVSMSMDDDGNVNYEMDWAGNNDEEPNVNLQNGFKQCRCAV